MAKTNQQNTHTAAIDNARADQTNLSPSRTTDGISKDTATIPAVGPHDDGRSDNKECSEKESPSAPLAQLPHRNTAMNTIVSPEAITSATAIPRQSVTVAGVDHRGTHPETAIVVVDPVYAMIERHKAAAATFNRAVNHPGVGDVSHPQNTEAERVNDLAMRECTKCTKQLFVFRPSTPAGVASLLQYISTLQDWEMPSYFNEPESVRGVKKLCKTMATALDDASIISTAIRHHGVGRKDRRDR